MLIERKPASSQLIIPDGNFGKGIQFTYAQFNILGELLFASKLGSAIKFKKYYSNFNIKNRSDFCTIKFRHRNSTQQNEIHIPKKRNLTEDGPNIYKYESFKTENLYRLILQTSLLDKIFGSYLHQFVAVTKESLNLHLEEQPWYFGNITDTQKFAIASGTFETNLISYITNSWSFIIIVLFLGESCD